MTVQDVRPGAPSETSVQDQELQALWQRVVGRRSFLKQAALASAAAVPVSAIAASSASAKSSGPTEGDIAILRFLAAAEILETDLWEQYNELGGADGGNPAYVAATENIDSDQPAYISGNTRDERSHADFLNAYLVSKGASAGEPGAVPYAQGKPSDGCSQRPGTAHEPHAPQRRYELVPALPFDD